MRLLARLPTLGERLRTFAVPSGPKLTVTFPTDTDVRCARCGELAAGPMYCVDVDTNAWVHRACAKHAERPHK
jgi:hypothetical protein